MVEILFSYKNVRILVDHNSILQIQLVTQ